MPQDITAHVLRNVDLGGGNYLLEFPAAELVGAMLPAQFFMIGIPGAEPLLRRPFSVCGLPGTFEDGTPGAAQVLYKVLGRGTGLLASLNSGAPLTVLGPLGRGFTPPPAGVRPVFVAGGIGSAPFPAFAAARGRAARPLLFYGARRAADLPLVDWFAARTELIVTTEDGSRGERGRVTEPLAAWLEHAERSAVRLYACGPEPMLRAVRQLALRSAVDCELSLEAHMACGFGVCLGCVVPTHEAGGVDYTRICVDGPVMRAERVAW
ncbi:MAG TPA: dihydroorotate dehydrogenase electron transfer subunit [Candidatus Polarisedimenticolaceae bacterium]|nr:dihydroorotate dehydrogenase electron transfer subunit [Candidatus Polarisedimenticolaceae bacterium]